METANAWKLPLITEFYADRGWPLPDDPVKEWEQMIEHTITWSNIGIAADNRDKHDPDANSDLWIDEAMANGDLAEAIEQERIETERYMRDGCLGGAVMMQARKRTDRLVAAVTENWK